MVIWKKKYLDHNIYIHLGRSRIGDIKSATRQIILMQVKQVNQIARNH